MKNRTYTQNNPCYKSKIQYHMIKIDNLVNFSSPDNINPKLLLRHMESLKHFVEKQAEIQSEQITEMHRDFYAQPGMHN